MPPRQGVHVPQGVLHRGAHRGCCALRYHIAGEGEGGRDPKLSISDITTMEALKRK